MPIALVGRCIFSYIDPNQGSRSRCTQWLFSGKVSGGRGGSVAEWLAWWTQAQKDPGSNRSPDAVG